MVNGFRKLTYDATKLRQLKLTSLERRRQRGDLIETYKILSGKEKVSPNCLFTLDKNPYSTRSHELKLYTRRSRLELSQKKLLQPTSRLTLEQLPESVVKAATVNSFKNRLDRCAEWGISFSLLQPVIYSVSGKKRPKCFW